MNEVKPNSGPNPGSSSGARDWLEAELEDTLDEDYELEISEPALSRLPGSTRSRIRPPSSA